MSGKYYHFEKRDNCEQNIGGSSESEARAYRGDALMTFSKRIFFGHFFKVVIQRKFTRVYEEGKFGNS